MACAAAAAGAQAREEDAIIPASDPDRETKPPRRFCKKCNCFKPPRAHHCRTCGRCVVKMDHHCPWINNCLGQNNQKFFIQCARLPPLCVVVMHKCDATRAYRYCLYVMMGSIHALILLLWKLASCMSASGKVSACARPPARATAPQCC